MATASNWYILVAKTKLTIYQITLFAMLGALTFALKWVMSWIPNIEPVTLMVLIFGAVFGWKAIFPLYIYVAMELLYYGFGYWSICYLYIWLVPLILGIVCRKMESPLGWAVAAGSFGLAFGGLCAIVNIFIGGIEYAVAWWINGVFHDLLHCVGNFVIALVLFVPLRKLVEKLYRSGPLH